MGKRRRARESAMQILFQMDLGGVTLDEALNNFWSTHKYPTEVREFATRLVKGAIDSKDVVDGEIVKYAEHWDISRMEVVDRNILRLAIYEILYLKDIPLKVSIDEAIEIAKRFSTAGSGKFVNAILDKVAKRKFQRTEDANKLND